jgi:hypothetical protein
MVLKTHTVPPLETIYEESGSFISATGNFQQRSRRHRSMNVPVRQTINGLISARSIPTVDIQRQRIIHECQSKPPIEVRYRDGSKRYIHPSNTTIETSRRGSINSSHDDLSANSSCQHTVHSNTNDKSSTANTPLVFTVITAHDLDRAGITPIISSSPEESEKSITSQSQSNKSANGSGKCGLM